MGFYGFPKLTYKATYRAKWPRFEWPLLVSGPPGKGRQVMGSNGTHTLPSLLLSGDKKSIGSMPILLGIRGEGYPRPTPGVTPLCTYISRFWQPKIKSGGGNV